MAADAPRPPRSRTIPAALHAVTLERLRQTNPDTQRPFNCPEVAAWLAKEHACSVSRYAVERLRAAHEKYTDAQVVAAIREEFRDAIAPTKARLVAASKRLDTLMAGSTSVRDVAAGLNAYTRALQAFTTLSGVAAPTQIDVTGTGPITLEWPDAPAEGGADGAPARAAPEAE